MLTESVNCPNCTKEFSVSVPFGKVIEKMALATEAFAHKAEAYDHYVRCPVCYSHSYLKYGATTAQIAVVRTTNRNGGR